MIYLSLAKNRITKIPETYFDNMTSLKTLDLSNNELEQIRFNLKDLRSLEYLNLKGNYIKTLSLDQMKSLDSLRSAHLAIDLSKNDLICSCSTLDFLKWITYHNSVATKITFKNLDQDRCVLSNSTKRNLSDLQNIINGLDKQCASYTGVIVGCVIAISVLLIVCITGILYRYRWQIRYFYYMAKRGYRGREHENRNFRDIFQYDAFVSYDDDDRHFALQALRHELEEKKHLRLCFHQRDFIPGFEISENIANAIRSSRKTVCVISNSYLSSHWCMYEFNMALMERIHARDGEDMLVLALMPTIKAHNVPNNMLEFIRRNTYIEIPENKTQQTSVLARLAETVYE